MGMCYTELSQGGKRSGGHELKSTGTGMQLAVFRLGMLLGG